MENLKDDAGELNRHNYFGFHCLNKGYHFKHKKTGEIISKLDAWCENRKDEHSLKQLCLNVHPTLERVKK